MAIGVFGAPTLCSKARCSGGKIACKCWSGGWRRSSARRWPRCRAV